MLSKDCISSLAVCACVLEIERKVSLRECEEEEEGAARCRSNKEEINSRRPIDTEVREGDLHVGNWGRVEDTDKFGAWIAGNYWHCCSTAV
jgi:hypothetical protein